MAETIPGPTTEAFGEIGIYVLACNRTGMDKTLDCSFAESFIIDGDGEILGRISSQKDAILYGNLSSSMVKRGLLANGILSRRRPEHYGEISLDPYSHINIVILLTFYLNELINPVNRITHFSHSNELCRNIDTFRYSFIKIVYSA